MVRATLSAASAGGAEQLAERLAGEGGGSSAGLKIHDPATTAERLTIPFTDPKTPRAFVFVQGHVGSRPGAKPEPESGADHTLEVFATYDAAVSFDGNIIDSVIGFPSRREAVIAVGKSLYRHIARGANTPPVLAAAARELNVIVKNLDDGASPAAGEACEWPMAEIDEEKDATAANEPAVTPVPTPADDEETINEDGDIECAGDVDDGSAVNTELAGSAESACGEKGERFAAIDLASPGGEYTAEIVVKVEDGEATIVSETIRAALPSSSDAQRAARLSLARATAEADFNRKRMEAINRAMDARVEVLNLKEQLKEANATEVEAVKEFRRICARGVEYLPLIDSAESAAATNHAAPSPPSTLPPPELLPPPQAEAATAAPFGDSLAAPTAAFREDWESVDIAELKLSAKITERLCDAGCTTMGKLEAKRGSFNGLRDIDGIGEKKADAIEEAILGWLSKNRDSSAINAVRQANHEAGVAEEGVALESAAQSQ